MAEREQKKPDWKKIKAAYITGEDSYRELADKNEIPFRTLADRAKREGWVALRAKHRERVVTKSCRRKEKAQVESIARLKTSADKMVKVLDQAAASDYYLSEDYAMDSSGRRLRDERGRFIKVKSVDAKGFRSMVAAMRDLTQLICDLYGVELKPEADQDGGVRVVFEQPEDEVYGQ